MLAFPGRRRSSMRSMIARYCCSSAFVASGAFRNFSNRAWNTRLFVTFQFFPLNVRTSEPGSKMGTSWPKGDLFAEAAVEGAGADDPPFCPTGLDPGAAAGAEGADAEIG